MSLRPLEMNRVYNTDCVVGMRSIAEGSVDLAFADPPFNIGYKYDVYDDQMAANEYLDWTRQWGAALVRALKPTGSFWLAIGDDFAAELKMIFQRELKLTCRSWVIWYYTFGVNCRTKFSRSHTHLFHFVKDPKAFTFNGRDIRVPSARQLVYGDSRADENGRLPDDTWVLRPQDLPEGFAPEDDTWYFPRVCGTFKERAGWHGCQMPEQLLGRIIKVSSNPGGIVLDPFGGSGTTFVVARKLGRQFIGFELSKDYANRISHRLRDVREGEPLAGAADPKVSAPATARGKRRGSRGIPAAGPTFAVRRTKSEDVDLGICEAFFIARDGFPVDRVIADPSLNAWFAEICTRFGLPGDIVRWNHRLLNLRKAGRFKGLPRSRITTFPDADEEFERYKFAYEIAMQHFHKNGNPLDRVLCDPRLANEFDEYVRSMIPARLTSLKIRWFSLRLRKRASIYKKHARELGRRHVSMPNDEEFEEVGALDVPENPGLYWLRSRHSGRRLYVGETVNLRQRVELQFANDSLGGEKRSDLELGYQRLDCPEIAEPNQAIWIGIWNPEWNYAKLAFADLAYAS